MGVDGQRQAFLHLGAVVGAVLCVSGAAAQIVYPRGDANCSARLSAVDLVASVRGAGGHSVCGNDDCDRDGVVTPADLACAAGCLFGDCPVPPGAPRVTSVVPDNTPRIVPFSVVRVTADHLGSTGRINQVTIDDVEARIVGQPSPTNFLVVVPNLQPGPADVVIHDDDVAGFPLRIDVRPSVPIGAADTFAGTLDLVEQVLDRLAALDLEDFYGTDANAVSGQLLFLSLDLGGERQRLAMDPTFTPQLQAQLDAAFEGSGIPERLRALLADIDALAARGATAAVENGGAAQADFFTVAGILSTTAAAIGGVILAGGAAGLAPALVASLLINGAGFLALEGAGVTAPSIFRTNFFDASFEPIEAAVERGMITMSGARMSGTSLVISTARRELVVSPQGSSNSFIQFKMPSDAYGLCGEAFLVLRRDLPPFAESNRVRMYIKPELTRVIGPNPAKPGDSLVLGVRGVAGCEALANFLGAEGGGSVAAEYRSNVEVEVPVPALLPGDYTVDMRVGVSETEKRGLRVISPVTGLELSCDQETLHVSPATPKSTRCVARPLPVGAKIPLEFQVFRWTSSDEGTALVHDLGAALGEGLADVNARSPGNTAITASMPKLKVTSNALSIQVTDITEPTVNVSAPDAVAPGGSLAVGVSATDNLFVSRIVLHASGDAVVNGEQEFPCRQLDAMCAAQFTVNIKQSGFTGREVDVFAEAFDGSGNVGVSSRVRVTVTDSTSGDTHCPQLTVQSPADGATVNAGSTVLVTAQATDNQPGDTGIRKFTYSATGPALVANVGPQDSPSVQPLPPQAMLRFNFQVKSAADLGSVTDRTILINVQAFDNAMPALACGGPRIVRVTAAGSAPRPCRDFPFNDCGQDSCDINTHMCCGRSADCSDGTICTSASQCIHGACDGHCCGVADCGLGTRCTSSSQCSSGICDPNRHLCCGARDCSAGTPCAHGSECDGGVCDGGKCVAYCDGNSECVAGQVCKHDPCTRDSDCGGGFCHDGKCSPGKCL